MAAARSESRGRGLSQQRLTTAQQEVAAELVSIGTGMNCYEDALMMLSAIGMLIDAGQPAIRIIRWMHLLPRAKNATLPAAPVEPDPDEQLLLVTPLAGRHYMPKPHRLMDPDAPMSKPGPRAERERRRRKPTGLCSVCGVEFQMNQYGRPAETCPDHRK